MTAIRTARSDSAQFGAQQGFGQPPPPRRQQRNTAGVLLGLLLIVFSAVAVALYAASVGHRRAVLVVTRSVQAGSVIVSADLSDVRISADPALHSIPASQRDRIVGKVAAVSLVPGELVTSGQLSTGPRLAAGQAVVGVSLRPGQFPAALRPPDEVMVVDTGPTVVDGSPSASATSFSPSVLVARAEVFSVDVAADGQTTVVSIITPQSLAPQVVEAGARGGVSLVLLGGPGSG
jgi:hypothetical protein